MGHTRQNYNLKGKRSPAAGQRLYEGIPKAEGRKKKKAGVTDKKKPKKGRGIATPHDVRHRKESENKGGGTVMVVVSAKAPRETTEEAGEKEGHQQGLAVPRHLATTSHGHVRKKGEEEKRGRKSHNGYMHTTGE